MGLFDFISGAGDSEDINSTVEVSPERLDELRRECIIEKLAELDIDGEQISVVVNGEVASLSGSAPSQEALEKMVLCAGNQFGIGRVDAQITVDAPPPETTETAAATPAQKEATAAAPAQEEATFYTVKSGDSLGKIAAEHYGDAGKYTVIFEANRPMLSDPNKIYPGQSLRIPPL